jgi:amino acid adenylation domain-containing protein
MRLHHYLARSAGRTPDALAVSRADERLNYRELAARARRLARLLQKLGIEAGDRVALMSPKTPAAIAAMHATLEAGAAYVPLDLASPAARAQMVLRSAEPRVVVAGAAARDLLVELKGEGVLEGAPVVALEDVPAGAESSPFDYGPDDWAGLDPGPLDQEDAASELAHILFTSGSTGTPKGVQITHSMAAAFIDWALDHFGTAPGERISCHPPLHFDLSTFDIYATLAAGAELHLVPAEANMLPGALAEFIRGAELDQWFSVPSTLAFMTAAGVIEEGDFPSLKRVLFCGEAMPTPVLAEWMRLVPHSTYTNLYGPTEATIASSYCDFDHVPEDETEPVPIGFPCRGERLHVLGDDLEPLETGETGDIYISGVGLSPGYWRDPEKTAAAFVQRPSDGLRIYRTGDLGWVDGAGRFMYSGRVDSQIKHRGYRIELGEIEAALNALGTLAEVAVVAVATEGFEQNRVCCSFVARDEEAEANGLRRALRESLPPYMIPTEWQARDALPKNASGKIDRRALRESFAEELSASRA